MTKSLFNEAWSVRRKVSGFVDLLGGAESEPVTLPHDAMITLERSAAGVPSAAFFPGGEVEYRKEFEVPDEWRRRRVSLEFEGVYRDAMIFVNDEFAGQWKYGYSVFRIALDAHLRYGERNTVRVEARAHRDSRWYSGLGIYRDVHLVVAPLAHLVDDDIRVTTPDVDDERAVVEVAVPIQNEDVVTRRLTLEVDILDASSAAAGHRSSPVTLAPGASTVLRSRLYVDTPRRWSLDDPYLYRVVTRLRDEDDEEAQVVEIPLGIRTLRLDPKHGLRINDVAVRLRGACVHHDNGPLGAATIRRAEERRIELLKDAGFNAVRSAHQPMSPAMLDACDRLGMLVFDEPFDAWIEMKQPFDYTLDFAEWWRRDVDAMVRKDINHPSVVLYGIGNEIHEYGSGAGGARARDIVERIRAIDDTRFVTTAISGFWAVAGEVIGDLQQRLADATARGVNDVMNEMGQFFDGVTLSDTVTVRTAESLAAVDITGLNYAESRYEMEFAAHPERLVLGTENSPRPSIDAWRATTAHPHVLGSFTWTGWDYLGEVGLGRTDYSDDPDYRGGGDPQYPWLTAWSGDIDITGCRRPQSYFREIAFGLRSDPYIAVRRPEFYGRRRLEMQWAWSDAISTWTWDVDTGSRVEVEVYSADDEVELLLDGVSVGRAAITPGDFTARFDIGYQPGSLTAVGYRDGRESGRYELRTAQSSALCADVDRRVIRADSTDLAFIALEYRDANGVLDTRRRSRVEVEVDGPGVLQALASARPETEERFTDSWCTLFDGRAVAVVRPTAAGRITVTVRGDDTAAITTIIESREASA